MCSYCGKGEPEGRWKTPPATPERIAEVKAWEDANILDVGHTIRWVEGFAYTVGRALFSYPELLVTGPLPPDTSGYMLNHVAELEANGKINVLSLADGRPMDMSELGFGCALRFVVADPHAADMLGAIHHGGDDVAAVQIIWPDKHGVWPDEIGYHFGPDAQPIYTKGD